MGPGDPNPYEEVMKFNLNPTLNVGPGDLNPYEQEEDIRMNRL